MQLYVQVANRIRKYGVLHFFKLSYVEKLIKIHLNPLTKLMKTFDLGTPDSLITNDFPWLHGFKIFGNSVCWKPSFWKWILFNKFLSKYFAATNFFHLGFAQSINLGKVVNHVNSFKEKLGANCCEYSSQPIHKFIQWRFTTEWVILRRMSIHTYDQRSKAPRLYLLSYIKTVYAILEI